MERETVKSAVFGETLKPTRDERERAMELAEVCPLALWSALSEELKARGLRLRAEPEGGEGGSE